VQQVVVVQEPQVDIGKVIEDALRIAANAVIMNTVHNKFGEQFEGASSNIIDGLAFLHKSFENLNASNADSFVWEAAREEFVENFLRLAQKSQAQVGHSGNKTFGDIHAFVAHFSEHDSAVQRKVLSAHHHHHEEKTHVHHEEHHHEKKSPSKAATHVDHHYHHEEEEHHHHEHHEHHDHHDHHDHHHEHEQVEDEESKEVVTKKASPQKKKVYAKKQQKEAEDFDSDEETHDAKFKARKQFLDDDGFIVVDTKKKQEEDLHYGRGGYRGGRYHRGGYN
jgi:hypothetical protein